MKLQNKLQEIEPYLNGRCIYLVGQFFLFKSKSFVFNE
jgi:hypothetical protein